MDICVQIKPITTHSITIIVIIMMITCVYVAGRGRCTAPHVIAKWPTKREHHIWKSGRERVFGVFWATLMKGGFNRRLFLRLFIFICHTNMHRLNYEHFTRWSCHYVTLWHITHSAMVRKYPNPAVFLKAPAMFCVSMCWSIALERRSNMQINNIFETLN